MHELTIIPEAWTCFKILCLIGDTRHSHMRWQTPTVRIREAGNSEGARSSGIGRGRDESTWKVWNSSHENNGRRRAAAVSDAGHGLGPKLALLTQPAQGRRRWGTACEGGEGAGPDQVMAESATRALLEFVTAAVRQWPGWSSGRAPHRKGWVAKLCPKINVGNPLTHENKEEEAA